jgi:hypothetical protein
MGWFLQCWVLLAHQDLKLGGHNVARPRSSASERHRAVKSQAKKLVLVNRRCGRHEAQWRFASRTLTGRADQKVSCSTNL